MQPKIRRETNMQAISPGTAPEPARYTQAAFHEAVLATRPHTAVFDCDGTLWAPDTGYGFMVWSLEQELVSPQRGAWIRERYRLYEAGLLDEATICGEMVQLYAGLREAEVRASARAYFLACVGSQIFPEMALLVRALREAGTEVWAVSSTSRLVIEAGVWAEGQSGFLIPPERIHAVEVASRSAAEASGASRPRSSRERFNQPPHSTDRWMTDRLLAVPTDEAKAEALAKAGLPHPDLVFGNSIHDAAMLSIARHPFPVNPSAELTAYAGAQGWRCFQPAL